MKDAKEAATKALRSDPEQEAAHLIVGTVNQELGLKEAAIESYERYLALAPKGRFAGDVRKVLAGMK